MDDPKALEAITEVKRRHESEILAKRYVVGFGIGFRERNGVSTDELSLVVFVVRKLPEEDLAFRDRIPQVLDGFPVDVREIGVVKAF